MIPATRRISLLLGLVAVACGAPADRGAPAAVSADDASAADVAIANGHGGGAGLETLGPNSAAMQRAAALAASCSGCHVGAARDAAIPGYDGLSRDVLAAALQTYRFDMSGQTVMHRIARGYTAEELDAIAAYLAEDAA